MSAIRTETTTKRWFTENVAFVSWHKHWKGIYLHFFPVYCVRLFLWGIDWHRKP